MKRKPRAPKYTNITILAWRMLAGASSNTVEDGQSRYSAAVMGQLPSCVHRTLGECRLWCHGRTELEIKQMIDSQARAIDAILYFWEKG